MERSCVEYRPTSGSLEVLFQGALTCSLVDDELGSRLSDEVTGHEHLRLDLTYVTDFDYFALVLTLASVAACWQGQAGPARGASIVVDPETDVGEAFHHAGITHYCSRMGIPVYSDGSLPFGAPDSRQSIADVSTETSYADQEGLISGVLETWPESGLLAAA